MSDDPPRGGPPDPAYPEATSRAITQWVQSDGDIDGVATESDQESAPPVAVQYDGTVWHVPARPCPYTRGECDARLTVPEEALERLHGTRVGVNPAAVPASLPGDHDVDDDGIAWLRFCRACIPDLRDRTDLLLVANCDVHWPTSPPAPASLGNLPAAASSRHYRLQDARGDVLHTPSGDAVQPVVVTDYTDDQLQAARASLRPFIVYEESLGSADIRLSLAPVFCQFSTEALQTLSGLYYRLQRETAPAAVDRTLSFDYDERLTDLNLPGEALHLEVPIESGRPVLAALSDFIADVSNWRRYASPAAGVDTQLYPSVLPAQFPHPDAPSLERGDDHLAHEVPVDAVPQSFDDVQKVKTAVLARPTDRASNVEQAGSPLAVGDECPTCGRAVTDIAETEAELAGTEADDFCIVDADDVAGHDDLRALLLAHSNR
jgi:hypothetical protein